MASLLLLYVSLVIYCPLYRMYHDVTMWSSGRLISQGYNKDSPDGLHLGPVATEWDVQILLNMYCKDHMNFNDGTCCSSAEPVTVIQIITAVLFGVW
jgi:hypothetical protein